MCPVEFRAPAFEVWTREVAEGEDLGALRDAHAPSWTVQWDRGQVYFLPVTSSGAGLGPPAGTTKTELETAGNLRLLARLTTNALIRSFPDYEPLRRKPFTFLDAGSNCWPALHRTWASIIRFSPIFVSGRSTH